ncbi:hypothetical protein CFE70_003516 [Pyrenophora teres f. teres 0-1]
MYQAYIKAVIPRYRNSNAVFAWELANEPRCTLCLTSVLTDWVRKTSDYIRSLDSDHMIAIGDEGFGLAGGISFPYLYLQGIDWETNLALPNISFGTFHFYPDSFLVSNTAGNGWIEAHAKICQRLNKPCLFEEYGVKNKADHCPVEAERAQDRGVQCLRELRESPALPSLGYSNNSLINGPSSGRPSFTKYQSDITAVGRNTPSIVQEEEEEEYFADSFRPGKDSGLGIAASGATPQTARRVSIQPFARRASGPGPKSPPSKSPGTVSSPGSTDPCFGSFPRGSVESTPDLRRERFSPDVGKGSPDVGTYEEFRHGILKNAKRSNTSINDYENYIHSSDTERIRGGGAAPSIKSAYENDFRPTHECATTRDFYQPSITWLNVSLILVCLFSCVFSGIFLALAIRAPHYGRLITSHGPVTPADAILLTTVLAKLIELSFVTAFVAFLGQVLSRRAFMKDQGRGVTLSELSMWRWIVQPGTLVTRPDMAKYAGLSFLGIMSLISAVLATLYTSAAAATVQPMLRDGNWDKGLVLAGRVKSDFANINYLKAMCPTPIRTDKKTQGETCLQMEHAGQGYHNFQRYLSDWDVSARNGNGTSDLNLRPKGFGLLYQNTTVTGQWIDMVNTTEVSRKFGRAINNITMAMPHSGVFAAARDQRNGILQPEELNSEGTYSLRASVPSPIVNVLCANMNKTELAPIVYDAWPNNDTVNVTTWGNLRVSETRLSQPIEL